MREFEGATPPLSYHFIPPLPARERGIKGVRVTLNLSK